MFVTVGKQRVNMLGVTVVEEGSGGVLRLTTFDGKAVYVRAPEDLAAVNAALASLAFIPKANKKAAHE